MNNVDVLAVVNDECVFARPYVFGEFMEEDYDGDFARIAECLTEKVTGDSRFINAIGVEKAKNAHFHIEIFGSECEECNNLDTFLAIKMDIAGEDTAFYLEYEMVQCGRHEGIAPQAVAVTVGRKTYPMHIFEWSCSGCTSPKTLKNERCTHADTLEQTFQEILAEDFIITH